VEEGFCAEPGPQSIPSTPAGWRSTAARMQAAGAQLDTFFGDVGQDLGESTGFLSPAEKATGNRYQRQALDLTFLGLVGNARAPAGGPRPCAGSGRTAVAR
jgi:hypothetical protein